MYLTELEIVESQKQNLHLLDQQIANQKFNIEELAEFIPGFVHLNNLEDISIKFVNKSGENFFGLKYDEMIELGVKHMIDNYHPSTFTDVVPSAIEFCKLNDEQKIFGYTQFLRRDNKQEFVGFMAFSKISRKLDGLLCVENPVTVFGELASKLNRILEDNEFLRKNYKRFASLTKREVEIIRLIGNGTSRNDIAEILFISTNTLDTHRKNIRKKLNISTSSELFQYIYAFDLI